jgi:hypothetical protein
MKRQKLTSREQEQLAAGLRQAGQESVREFESVEAMLRHDALHTPVPPAIAARLQQSIDSLPPRRPWWRRLFGR